MLTHFDNTRSGASSHLYPAQQFIEPQYSPILPQYCESMHFAYESSGAIRHVYPAQQVFRVGPRPQNSPLSPHETTGVYDCESSKDTNSTNTNNSAYKPIVGQKV